MFAISAQFVNSSNLPIYFQKNTHCVSFRQLQDLAVSPGIRDPKLNTAECVIEGHDTDIDATGRNLHIRFILWSSFLFVFVSCNLLSSFLEEYRKLAWSTEETDGNANGTNTERTPMVTGQGNENSQENTEKNKKKINTAKAICILCFVLAGIGSCIIIFALIMSFWKNSPTDFIAGLVVTFVGVNLLVFGCRKKKLSEIENYSLFLTLCASVTSYISCWLLIGIMINPTWGLTVTLLVAFLGAAFAYAVYEYISASDHKRQVGISCVCGVFAVIFLGVVAVMAGQSYNGRETADETVKTALLSVIGLLVSWVSWKRKSSNKSANKAVQTTNGQPEGTADTGL